MSGPVLDLFCGAAGGWSLGMHRAGYRTVAAAECDPWRRAAFLHNNPGVEMFDDVRAVTAESLRGRLGYLPNIIVGSPPCQDASIARRDARTGIDGERTGLFWEAVRLLRELRPDWACFENVAGLASTGHDRLVRAMERDGYTVWTFNLGAEDFGATAERRRLWMLALADSHKARLEDAWRQSGETWANWFGAAFRGLQAPRNPWRQGESHAVGMAAGLPSHVASGRIIAAYGDSVIPQIPEAIGRVMARLVPLELAA